MPRTRILAACRWMKVPHLKKADCVTQRIHKATRFPLPLPCKNQKNKNCCHGPFYSHNDIHMWHYVPIKLPHKIIDFWLALFLKLRYQRYAFLTDTKVQYTQRVYWTLQMRMHIISLVFPPSKKKSVMVHGWGVSVACMERLSAWRPCRTMVSAKFKRTTSSSYSLDCISSQQTSLQSENRLSNLRDHNAVTTLICGGWIHQADKFPWWYKCWTFISVFTASHSAQFKNHLLPKGKNVSRVHIAITINPYASFEFLPCCEHFSKQKCRHVIISFSIDHSSLHYHSPISTIKLYLCY